MRYIANEYGIMSIYIIESTSNSRITEIRVPVNIEDRPSERETKEDFKKLSGNAKNNGPRFQEPGPDFYRNIKRPNYDRPSYDKSALLRALAKSLIKSSELETTD